MNRVIKSVLSALLAVVMVQNAAADTTKSEDDWQFKLAPLFLWGMNINGTTAIGPEILPLDIEFDDVLSNMSGVLTFHFEARKRDLSLFAEYQCANLSPGAKFPNGSGADVDFKNTMMELGVAYRLVQFRKTDLEILGGTRYVDQEIEVKVKSIPSISSLSHDEDWWDAFVGGRVTAEINDKWDFIGRTDYGFGGSNGTWNLVGMFDYRFRDWGSVFFGYKWMDFDY
ncbi:MAG: hypothetical protein GY703_06290 [Gammaproteobacteria bacterium]|nr:hypothetical protein [Gammaproteobacteria bacterium]